MTQRSNFLARLFSKFEIGEPDECWPWFGRSYAGYGYFYCNRKLLRVHRLIYELVKGKIPGELQIDHTCGNPLCVNPYHLEAVTFTENRQRAVLRRTHCINGHEFSGSEFYDNGYGRRLRRICHICARAKQRRYLERKAA